MNALFTYEGVNYDALDIIDQEAVEVKAVDLAVGGWVLKVVWSWKPDKVSQYTGDTYAEVIYKAAKDRVVKGNAD